MKLVKREKETIILTNKADESYEVCTSNSAMKRSFGYTYNQQLLVVIC